MSLERPAEPLLQDVCQLFFLTHESFTRLLRGPEMFHEILHLGLSSQQATPLSDLFLLHAFIQHLSSSLPLGSLSGLGRTWEHGYTCTPVFVAASAGTQTRHHVCPRDTHVSPTPRVIPGEMVVTVASSSRNS